MKKPIIATLLLLTVSGCGDNYPTLSNREKYICSQCHGLPLADQHSAAEWPAVIDRMMGHIQANNKARPDDKEREEIIKFYQARSGR